MEQGHEFAHILKCGRGLDPVVAVGEIAPVSYKRGFRLDGRPDCIAVSLIEALLFDASER